MATTPNDFIGKMKWKIIVGEYENNETFSDFLYRNDFQEDDFIKDVISRRGDYTIIQLNDSIFSNLSIKHSLFNSYNLIFLILRNEDHKVLVEKPELFKQILLLWISEMKEKIKRETLNLYKNDRCKETLLKGIVFLDSMV